MKRLIMALSFVILMATSAEAQYHRPSGRYHRPMQNYTATRVRAPRNLGLDRNTLKLHVMGEVGIVDIGSVFYHARENNWQSELKVLINNLNND